MVKDIQPGMAFIYRYNTTNSTLMSTVSFVVSRSPESSYDKREAIITLIENGELYKLRHVESAADVYDELGFIEML